MAQIPRHRQAASSGLFFLLVVGLAATCVVTPQVADAQRGDADVLVAQAVLAYEDQNYEKAFDLLNRALQFEPQNARGLYYLGLVRLARQEPEQAIAPLEMRAGFKGGPRSLCCRLTGQPRYNSGPRCLLGATRPSLSAGP